MRFILREETDPYFNIAAEEFVLKNFEGDTFMLWRNQPSVIIGKHQNTLAEINLEFINKNQIKVVRRITGGGAVYHDLGNLNFTFTSSGERHHLVDFDKFTRPIVRTLNKLGIDVQTGKRNSLYINDLKISGNAEHVFKNSVLHHGTLLFSSNLYNLDEAIKSHGIQYTDKAVKSIRSKVTNISSYLRVPLDITEFTRFIFDEMFQSSDDAFIYSFSDADKQAIERLKDEKYSTWEWNYSYSPTFSFTVTLTHAASCMSVIFTISNGLITNVELNDHVPFPGNPMQVLESLKGKELKEKEITGILKERLPDEFINQLMHQIFKIEITEQSENRSV